MTNEQVLVALASVFGLQDAVDLTDLAGKAFAILLTEFHWPAKNITLEDLERAAHELHALNSSIDIETARAAISSVITKALPLWKPKGVKA